MFILTVLCITVVIPAFTQSKRETIEATRLANCKSLQDAATRCRLHAGIRPGIDDPNVGFQLQSMPHGSGDPPLSGTPECRSDTEAAYNFYVQNGYLQPASVDITGVEFLAGEWRPLPWE